MAGEHSPHSDEGITGSDTCSLAQTTLPLSTSRTGPAMNQKHLFPLKEPATSGGVNKDVDIAVVK